ncbi:MAG: R3H domain-containing nucleic acid-binding protein [Prochlorothrix sp.]
MTANSANPPVAPQSQAVPPNPHVLEQSGPRVEDRQVVDDLDRLLGILPPNLGELLAQHPQRNQLVEVVLDLGRRPEARFPGKAEYLSEAVIELADLAYCVDRVGHFGGDNRAGIERTLHRISALRNRKGDIIGLTCRVGRAVFGTIGLIRDLVETGGSILMLGRPGVGKTTALREIARVLADDLLKRVVIIDTSNEIAGDGDIPHPAIGRARRMQVAKPELQHQVMIEAVENHMPEVIIIDEIGTELEALAARTIAERGVQLVGTAHGNQIENLIKNPTLADLIGGIQSVTLGDDEARRRRSQKTVLERKSPPTFDIAVEMLERQRWVVHSSVADTVDALLRNQRPMTQVRSVGEDGQVLITQSQTPPNSQRVGYTPPGGGRSSGRGAAGEEGQDRGLGSATEAEGWRGSGQMKPLPLQWQRSGSRSSGNLTNLSAQSTDPRSISSEPNPMSSGEADRHQFAQLLDQSLQETPPEAWITGDPLAYADGIPLHVYPYAISRHHLEQAIHTLQLPVILTKDIETADAVLALRSHLKGHSKLRHLARTRQVPIHVIKSNTLPQMVRGLKRLLNREEVGNAPETIEAILAATNSNDELEALEEARLAVEQIVLPKGQPVELLPRPANIRKMQHELVEHYRLKANSFGEEPNRRLRIYPA